MFKATREKDIVEKGRGRKGGRGESGGGGGGEGGGGITRTCERVDSKAHSKERRGNNCEKGPELSNNCSGVKN